MALVREIRLYPVKGLDPVTVPEARVLSSGALEWDRRFAMVDARGRFVNGKNFPGIHTVRATFDLSRGEVMVEGRSFSMEREGPEFATWFAERLEEPLEWREDTAAGFPDDTDSPGPTLVSQASLDTVAEWFAFDAEQNPAPVPREHHDRRLAAVRRGSLVRLDDSHRDARGQRYQPMCALRRTLA
jgi:uncharacterized protein YcbX